MSDREKLALFEALSSWRAILAARYMIPHHRRIALVVRHDKFINGQVTD
jgi:hypothetical protein